MIDLRVRRSTYVKEESMPITTVSVRGQTVVPREIRRALNIEPESKLAWEIRDGEIVVHPIPANPVLAARGILRGRGLGTSDLLHDRRRERAKEAQRGWA
jgi:AbrB family looped-hinge helix DNA binding protein